jgi:hypothetical protein
MESNNKLVVLRDECEAKNLVTDSDYKKAESMFRFLAGCWVSDLAEETRAFKEIMEAYKSGGTFRHEYW